MKLGESMEKMWNGGIDGVNVKKWNGELLGVSCGTVKLWELVKEDFIIVALGE